MDSNWVYKVIAHCRICGSSDLEPMLSLGPIHTNAFPSPHEGDTPEVPLNLVYCDNCKDVQLDCTTNPDLLYRQYYYRSSTNSTMKTALSDVTKSIEQIQPLRPGDTVVDIGANDGTLLKSYSVPGLRKVAFEPSNIAAECAANVECEVVNDYFTAAALEAKVITSIAMFYDLDDPNRFVKDVAATLDDDGLWVNQFAYLPSILKNTALDGQCHEHLHYLTLTTVTRLLESHGFRVFDAIHVPINEGSVRIYAKKERNAPAPSARLRRMLANEAKMDWRKELDDFAFRVEETREQVHSFLIDAKASGRTVHAYGASTKGNTLLQYFGLDNSLVQAAWERQPSKVGLETVGTRIPIISEEAGRRQKPDYLLLLIWQFREEVLQREKDYLAAGGHFIIPLPRFEVV